MKSNERLPKPPNFEKFSIFATKPVVTTTHQPLIQDTSPVPGRLNIPIIPSSEVLFQNAEVCIVSPNTPGSVLVIHYCRIDVFNAILKDGVKSRVQLFDEGKMPFLVDNLINYNWNVFFRCFRSYMTIDSDDFVDRYKSHSSEWIAISVDPSKTFAYNSRARIKDEFFNYLGSKISLSDLMNGAQSHSSEVLVKLPVINPNWYAANSKSFKEELLSSRAPIKI